MTNIPIEPLHGNTEKARSHSTGARPRQAPPRWASYASRRRCPVEGQLWIVTLDEGPLYVGACTFLPLDREWAEVLVQFRAQRHGVQWWWRADAVRLAVLALGPVTYEGARVLFGAREITINEMPGSLDRLVKEVLQYTITVVPSFDDLGAVERVHGYIAEYLLRAWARRLVPAWVWRWWYARKRKVQHGRK